MGVAAEVCRTITSLTENLMVCGSLRRRKLEVGDVEFVYIPRIEQRPDPADLFGKVALCDLVNIQLDEWLKSQRLVKRLSKDGKPCWGQWNKLGV